VLGLIKLEIAWIVFPLLLTLVMFAWGAVIFFRAQTAPEGAIEIDVVGKQWMWKIAHRSGRGEINELHVPVGRPVKLRLISEDVIHSFFVPAFRVKQDVLPGRYTSLWFEATQAGEYHLFCAEYCGTNHSKMTGRVVVLDPAYYQEWLAASVDEPSTSERGQLAFQRFFCDRCHSARDDKDCGPALAGKFGRPVRIAGGKSVTFDATYVRESILQPRQKLAEGFPPIMPTYEGQITEGEILAIVDYLKITTALAGTRPPSRPIAMRSAETLLDVAAPPRTSLDGKHASLQQ
jgi:cytochrome c oxidase subunit 2